ncbi:MAG: hypothetical protein DRG78_13110, partial [Epsilonproteobacteria bacterium]
MKIIKVKFKDSLFFKLMFWFLILTLVPLSISTYQSYTHSVKSLENAAKHELEQSSLINFKFIQNWFYYREVDISSWSKSKSNIDFVAVLQKSFNKSNLELNKYIKSDDYLKMIRLNEHDLLNTINQYDYIYDVLIIDNAGDILYTIAKEDDLGTNLLKGKYKETKFAKSFAKTIKNQKVYFSDLELYSANSNDIAGFFTAPLVDKTGNTIGALAIQIKLDRIFALFEEEDYVHYLVGEDSLLRSNISSTCAALKYKVESKQFNLWYEEHGPNPTKPNIEDELILSYQSSFNKEVYGLHQNINILGIKWVLISEVDKDLILSSIEKARYEVVLFFILTVIIILIIAFLVTRKITLPILKLQKASLEFADGDKTVQVKNKDNNEIGLLSQSFNKMVNEIAINELELDEQKYALNAHSIVAITDVKGNITFVNDKFLDISGYKREELIGKQHRMLNSGAHSKEFWHEMYKMVSSGNIWNEEVCNVAKDGHYYWVDTTIIPFMDANNKPKSYIAIRTDITQKKDAELKLIEANEMAQDSVKAKSEFLASMSHEIRTPMNGVIGMLGLLLKTNLDNTQRHQASLAQSSASALLTLINDILDFSKVEAGKMELEHIDFDIRDELGKFAEAMAFKAQEKGVELLLDLTGIEQSLVNGDPGRIRQILSNIVGNSVKFTSEGYILIRATVNTADKQNPRLIIEMSDTGIGIPEDKIATLFDSFSQVDASTTRKYGGTGLGLAIVKQLTSLMHGEVIVTSNYGHGSTFSVNIAIGISDKAILVEPRNSVEEKKILIVDNSEYSTDVLHGQLEYWGMEVDSTCSAKEALEILKKEKFDILFLDMFIEDMDTCEFAREIRQNKDYDDMKLVVMTSLKDRGNALEYKTIGIDGSFPKPATTNDLLGALNVMFSSDAFVDEDELEEDVVDFGAVNILLVEDNLTNQLVANGILEGFSLEADIANNGVEALEILNANEKRYDIILMDCQMPQMDGYETTGAIRDEEAGSNYKDIPIVAMTANAMQGDKEKCSLAGMDDYIAKPIDPELLKSVLKKWLSHSESKQIVEISKATTSSDDPLVWNKEEAFKRLGNSEKLLNKVMEVFLEDIKQEKQNLSDALDKEDRVEMKLQ